MSPFFISYIKRTCSCNNCKASPREGYKLCENHLAYARRKWMTWQTERRAKGLCISCDRKGVLAAGLRNKLGHRIAAKGVRLLRCRHHTMLNRERCALWCRLHPEAYQRSREREKRMLDAGLCRCAEHNRLKGGFRRCEDCRKRGRR